MSEEEVKENENVEETPEVEEEDSSNPIFNALFKAVEKEEPEEGEEEEEFTPPSSLQSALHDIEVGNQDEPQPEEEATAEPQATEEIKEAPKRVARKKKIIDPDFKPQAKIPSKPQSTNVDTSGLNEAEKERYDLAKWASSNVDGFKGKDAEYLQFFRNHKNYLEKRIQEDPDIDFQEDEDYKRFLAKNKVQFNANQVKDVRLQKQAEDNALKKLTPEIQKQQRELHRLRAEPVAKKAIEESKKLIAKAVPAEIMEQFQKNPQFTKTHALEAKIVDRVLGDANKMIEAFHAIASDIVDFDEKNPVHIRLSNWINQEQEAFIQSGKTKRGGRTFVRRERFPNVPASDRNKYYTFSDSDVIQLLAKRAGDSMSKQISKSLEELQASGFVRQLDSVQKTQPPQVEQSVKRMNPSPRPGPSMETSNSDQGENKVLSLLGL
jgi:hypothetical protein